VRTAFVWFVNNVEFIGDFDVEQHRKKQDSEDYGIDLKVMSDE